MPTQRQQLRNVLWIALGGLVLLTAMSTTAMAQADVEEKNRQAVKTGFDNW